MELIDLLRALPPAGLHGLEGLVAMLLGDALGLEARLEASGPQAGRDIGLFDRATGKRRNIDIEVKRYGEGKSPGRRMLLGELAETRRDRPETELWVLVSTAALPAALVDALQDEAFHSNIDVLVLDCATNGASTLEILMARRQKLVLDWIVRAGAGRAADWKAALAAVRRAPAYAVQEADIAERLVSRYAADAARRAAHAWLVEHVRGRRKRIEGLNQSLGRLGRAPEVSRPVIEEAWQSWLGDKRGETRLLAMLGGEGDGKTWTAIDALLADRDAIPLIATSNMFDDGGASSLIAAALAQQCGGDSDRWRSRLESTRKALPADFRMLLLIDGLNEAPNRRTDQLLNEILLTPWGGRLDVIVTCRMAFWSQRIAPYIASLPERISVLTIGPFDPEDEWPVARGHLGPGGKSLPSAVSEALRNPRLWSFAYDLKDQLGGLGEITLERLLVEHWRLRIADREDLKVDPASFNRLVGQSVDLVRKSTEGGLLEQGDLDRLLRRMVTGVQDFTPELADIRDGVFFRSARDNRMLLRTERVPVALGLLLSERLIAAAEGDDPAHAVHRAAAVFLDDLPASDRVELIVRTAIFAILGLPGDRRHLLPTLLRHWVSLQNFESDFYRALAIVAAAAPADCIFAIEDEASEDEMVGEAAADLSAALRGRRNRPAVREAMLAASIRWLRSYSEEHFPALARRGAEGLLASSITWVETLDDTAATFLANLPPDDWTAALGYWARRRRAYDALNRDIYHYDDALGWLGLSGVFSDPDATRLIEKSAAASAPSLTKSEVACVAQLLNGAMFRDRTGQRCQELNAAPWDETGAELKRIVDAHAKGANPAGEVRFEDLYRDASANSLEQWLQLERAVLDADGGALAGLVRGLHPLAIETMEDADAGGFAQFVRDHALLLGGWLKPSILRYIDARKQRGWRSAAHAGRAVAAGFVGDPAEHIAFLQAVCSTARLDDLDLTGFSPQPSATELDRLFVKANEGQDGAAVLYLATLAHMPAPPLADAARMWIVATALGRDEPLAALALKALNRSSDVPAARTISRKGISVAGVPNRAAARCLSELVIKGSAAPKYAELRRRVSGASFADAAAADGSKAAARQLVRDFEAILVAHAGEDWPTGPPAGDVAGLAAWQSQFPKKGVYPALEIGAISLDRAETARTLEVIERQCSGYRARLCDRADIVSDGALAMAEGKTGLVSVLAESAPPARALAWMERLRVNDSSRSDHRGLLVATTMRFAFLHDGAEAIALRGRIADEAWTDLQLLDLVCMAEMEGRTAWLEAWIESEEKEPVRARRLRALLLRGWRASEEDRARLESARPTNGYEEHVLKIAGRRGERRRKMAADMTRYAAARGDEEAWLAFRSLVHVADRRLVVESALRGWPEPLSHARRVNYLLASADFERLFGRTEGDLARLFAGTVHPTGIPPWGDIYIYGADGEGT